MLISLAEVKQYLRVTYDDDDVLLEQLLTTAQELCMAVARLEGSEEENAGANQLRIGILYAVAYLYEHREEVKFILKLIVSELCQPLKSFDYLI